MVRECGTAARNVQERSRVDDGARTDRHRLGEGEGG